MVEPRRSMDRHRHGGKEPAASALTKTPRVDGPGADHFGIQDHLAAPAPSRSSPKEPEDWGFGLIDLIAKPGWENERAKALLRTGATMPQMVRHLVAKGLSPEAAAAAAERAFEDCVAQQFHLLADADRAARVDRILSAIAACALIALTGSLFGSRVAWRMAPYMPACMAFSWIGHWLGQRSHRGNPPMRASVVRWVSWFGFGWVVLRVLLTEFPFAPG
jgi:hypothetical protein